MIAGYIWKRRSLALLALLALAETAVAATPPPNLAAPGALAASTPTTVQPAAVDPRSGWYGSADALWLRRNFPSSFQIAQIIDRNAAPLFLGTITLDDVSRSSYELGPRVQLGRRLHGGDALDLTYFGSQDWSRDKSLLVQDPPFAQSPFLGTSIPFANKGFDTMMTVRYGSTVHSAELNRTTTHSPRKWTRSNLVGLRYFRLRETLELTGTEQFTFTVEQTRARAVNDLFGVQVGSSFGHTSRDGKLGVTLGGKAGLFANHASTALSNVSQVTPAIGATPLLTERSTTELAGLLELNVTGTAKLGSRASLRAGYQFIYVDGLALAPGALAATGSAIRDFPGTALPAGIGQNVRASGDLVLHGPSLGVDVKF